MAQESMMSLDAEKRGDSVVMTPHGRLAEMEARQLERALLKRVEQGHVKIVIDLGDVPFMTSACLGAMMLVHKVGRKKGGYLRIVRPQPLVLQILQVTKLTKLFGLYDSVDDALQAD